MRLGIDGRKIPLAAERGPLGSVDHALELGMSGLFFRTILEMSPTLDAGELSDIAGKARDLGLYLETGLGKVNPYAIPETPELRAIGDGDTLLGFRRMMEAAARIGCNELWVGTANYKSSLPGRYACDRFRTDVSWTDQLAATGKFLGKLRPIARDLGVHINIETHEEISSWEVVRLVEGLGPDAFGIVYDTSNGLQRGENPSAAVRRVAPYTRQTHFKDAALFECADGLVAEARACGEGVVAFGDILNVLAEAAPDVNVTIECQQVAAESEKPVRHVIEVGDASWLEMHPDLSEDERDSVIELARDYARRLAAGKATAQSGGGLVRNYEEAVAAIGRSAAHLRSLHEMDDARP